MKYFLSKWIARLVSCACVSAFIDRFVNSFELKGKSFPFIITRRKRNCQILAYHRINDDNDPFFPGIPVTRFEQQMRCLVEHFTVFSLTELIQRMKDDDLPENAIAITLDDGYVDNYFNAFPVLKRYTVPATIFLATGVVGSREGLWHDRVFDALRQTRVRELVSLGPGEVRLSLASLAEKLEAQRQILKYLWSLDSEGRNSTIAKLCQQLEVQETQKDLMLSWDEIAEMNREGVQFGAHTMSHPILATLGLEEARKEVYGSKKAIEAVLNIAVSSFAYPVGRNVDFTDSTKVIVKEAGLDCGLTMIFGNNLPGTDLYEIRRIPAWNEEADSFGLRLKYYKFCS